MIDVQLVGYVGSFLIAVSLMMSNIVKLRWINLFGASTFAVYGGIIGAYPVLILNSFITMIDVYHLIQIYNKKDFFSIVEIDPKHSSYLNTFIEYYKNDIKKFFPDFQKDQLLDSKFVFILRNMVPAGLFIYNQISDDSIEIKLDYAIPDYRDFSNSKYFYSSETTYLKSKGFKKMYVESDKTAHQKYLLKAGFISDGKSKYVRNV